MIVGSELRSPRRFENVLDLGNETCSGRKVGQVVEVESIDQRLVGALVTPNRDEQSDDHAADECEQQRHTDQHVDSVERSERGDEHAGHDQARARRG